jgi:hypothetical protein
MDGTRWEDDRVGRRDLTGLLVGALAGFALALLLSATWTAPDQRWALLMDSLIGAAAGALLGRLLAGTVTPEEIEPHASNRPFVGGHSPDDDTTDGLHPRAVTRAGASAG